MYKVNVEKAQKTVMYHVVGRNADCLKRNLLFIGLYKTTIMCEYKCSSILAGRLDNLKDVRPR